MSDWILTHEAGIRLSFFLGVFAVMAIAERLVPRRRLIASRFTRWVNNLAIVAVNTLVLRFTVPVLAVAMAATAEQRGWGLLNNVPLPYWAAVLAAVVLLDLAIYLQHVLFHAVPALWRLHRMHHADPDIDVTTGARFHPLEIVLSMVLKLGAVSALGAPPLGVLVFEVLLNGTAMFNHSNVRLPAPLDRWLRMLVVTPDMHRVHHSVYREETDSNFGFNLPWWDRLLGTYRAQPRDGHEAMTIGLRAFRDPRELRLDRLITQPLRNIPAGANGGDERPSSLPDHRSGNGSP